MNNTPRVNQWWNAYRSGAINAGQFKEAIQGMERELLSWEQTSTSQLKPTNPPGFPKDDHVACLCVCKNEMRILQWNAHYKVWDDADGDDFFCDMQDVTHWMPLPPWPNTELRNAHNENGKTL